MDLMRGKEDAGEAADLRTSLAFVAFALSHTACGDGPVELRVDERCLLEWCPDCSELEIFTSSHA